MLDGQLILSDLDSRVFLHELLRAQRETLRRMQKIDREGWYTLMQVKWD